MQSSGSGAVEEEQDPIALAVIFLGSVVQNVKGSVVTSYFLEAMNVRCNFTAGLMKL